MTKASKAAPAPKPVTSPAAVASATGKPACLIVGYRMRVRSEEELETCTPEFEANRSLKDPVKIAEDIAKKRTVFLQQASMKPYLGTFDAVQIVDPVNKQIGTWNSTDRKPFGPKPPICLAIRQWLLAHYPNAWDGDVMDTSPPRVMFLGFKPRIFLKMLGLECSLPEYGQPLPLRMWYGVTGYRDIESAIAPDEPKEIAVPLEAALRFRRPIGAEDAAKWAGWLDKWNGPGLDPALDVLITAEVAAQLGLV